MKHFGSNVMIAAHSQAHITRIFETMDLNHDGKITLDEFVTYCTTQEGVRQSLTVFFRFFPIPFFFLKLRLAYIFFVIFLLLCTVWWHLKLDRVSKDIFSTLKLSSGVSFINRFVQSATNGLVNSILALRVLFSFTNKIMPNYTSGNN